MKTPMMERLEILEAELAQLRGTQPGRDAEELRHVIDMLDYWNVPAGNDERPVDRLVFLRNFMQASIKAEKATAERLTAERDEAHTDVQHWRTIAETAEAAFNRLTELRETPGAELAQMQAERDAWRDACGASTASAHAWLAKATEAKAEVERLRAQVVTLTTCDCGRPLTTGLCGVCDRDE